MTHEIEKTASERMKRSIRALAEEIAKIRTNRAHPGLIKDILVDCYGSMMPLEQVANVNIVDSRTLMVVPWDKKNIQAIEKALHAAELGINPMSTGDGVRLPLPPLTEERRKELVKKVKQESEHAKVAVRNIRRDANQEAKDLLKAKSMTEDDARRIEDAIQKITNQHIDDIDKLVHQKEEELMSI